MLTFGHCPKMTLTPAPHTRFDQPWGNFCLNRFPKTVQIKTTLKQAEKYLKTTSNIPKNYPKFFGIGSTPSIFSVMSKRRLTKTTAIFLGSGLNPPPPFWKMSKSKQLFSLDYFPQRSWLNQSQTDRLKNRNIFELASKYKLQEQKNIF